MLTPGDVVFLIDVDNTLLDNDHFAADLGAHLEQAFGAVERQRYWTLFAELRVESGYADYLATLQKFRSGLDDDPRLLRVAEFMLEYPFAERLYPRALETLAHLRTLGLPVILSDGDIVFQPRKIRRSGLWNAVEGRVLVYVHKERMRAAIQQRYPVMHYVMIDDKPQLLAAMKRSFSARLTTVLVRQGHYAVASADPTLDARPDVSVAHIGDLCQSTLADFLPATQCAASPMHVPEST